MGSQPMREDELRKHAECSICHQGIGATGLPLFYTVAVQRHAILVNKIQRQDGLSAVLGGNPLLAHVMGPDEEMTQVMMDAELTVCEGCAYTAPVISQALEQATDKVADHA